MSSSGRDISAPPGLPDGWKATQHHDTDSSDSSSVGRSYVRFHSVDGKHKNIPTAKQAIRIHCSKGTLELQKSGKARVIKEASKDKVLRPIFDALSGEKPNSAV